MSDFEIIRPPKTTSYAFVWQVIYTGIRYELQRYSKEYQTWFTTSSSFKENEIVKMYDQLSDN